MDKDKKVILNKLQNDGYIYKEIDAENEHFSSLEENDHCILVGRILQIHDLGKINFIQIERDDQLFQLVFSKNENADAFNYLKEFLQVGDIIEAAGYIYTTKKQIKSLKVRKVHILTKCLEWPGKLMKNEDLLNDPETLLRNRHIALNIDRAKRNILIEKSRIINYFRNFFLQKGFTEVDTRMLLPINSGAVAKPFKTHHNAYDMDLYLRIAPELDLKRLLIGGMDKIFEIGKNFRNEGTSKIHNPEFLSLEAYICYKTIDYWIAWSMCILHGLSNMYLHKSIKFVEYTMSNFVSLNYGDTNDIENEFERLIRSKEIIEKYPYLIITKFPAASSPLAAPCKNNNKYCERAEIYINGIEVANMYQELTDPIKQKENMQKYAIQNQEEFSYDEDYCRALEYGLPPCAGIGFGLERIIMWLLNIENIKEIQSIPLYKEQ